MAMMVVVVWMLEFCGFFCPKSLTGKSEIKMGQWIPNANASPEGLPFTEIHGDYENVSLVCCYHHGMFDLPRLYPPPQHTVRLLCWWRVFVCAFVGGFVVLCMRFIPMTSNCALRLDKIPKRKMHNHHVALVFRFGMGGASFATLRAFEAV